MLYLLNYYDSTFYLSNVLILLEILFLISAIYVVLSKNPIISILFLIILFLLVSVYLIIIGVDFLGISYLLVYIGAVSILFLFILMLIDIRISELNEKTTNSIITSLLFGFFIFNILYFYFPNLKNHEDKNEYLFTYVKEISYKEFEGSIIDNIDIVSIGNIIYTNLSL